MIIPPKQYNLFACIIDTFSELLDILAGKNVFLGSEGFSHLKESFALTQLQSVQMHNQLNGIWTTVTSLFFLQIYFYASYVFKEAGISDDQIQYITIGTGSCEFTACILCVSVHVYVV